MKTWCWPIAVWLLLSAAGAAFANVALTVLAPMPLLAVPILLHSQDRERRIDPFEPIWAFLLLFAFSYFAVPAFAALRPDAFTSLVGYLDTPPAQWQASTWMSGGAFLAAVAGYFGGVGPALKHLLPRGTSTTDGHSIGLFALALFVAGLAASIALVVISGGLELSLPRLLSTTVRGEAVRNFEGRGYLNVGSWMLALSIPCAALWASAQETKKPWAIVAIMSAISTVLLGAVLGSRNLLLAVAAGVLVVLHYRVRRFPTRTVVALAIVTAAAMVTVGALRYRSSASDPIEAFGVIVATFDGFHFLVNALARTQEFLWGATVLQDVVFTYLPRGLWAGKPDIYGVVSAQDHIIPGAYISVSGAYTFPPGLVAEGYLNFGVAGALAFPYLASALLRAVYLRLVESLHPFYIVFGAWLLSQQVGLIRALGPSLSTLAVVGILLSPLLILGAPRWKRLRRRTRMAA